MSSLERRFRFERELGRGGMASVHLAFDSETGRQVAVKILRPDVAAAIGTERFVREVAIVSHLDHPNILPLLASGTAGSTLWYSMPYVPGESLRQRLDAGGPIALHPALTIGRQVAEALDYAHREGIVHRDIKPENILLDGDRAWVADFGIARALAGPEAEPITSASLAVGTAWYMSPEQARGGPFAIDGRTDQYALGCVMYEMLAGAPPFVGPSREAILARHAIDPLPSVRTVRPTLPTGFDRVLQRALAKTPADRFDTATALIEALDDPPNVPRRARLGRVITAAAVLVAGLVVWRLTRTTLPLSDHRIAVLPLVVVGAGPLVGEDITTALVGVLNTSDTLVASYAEPGGPWQHREWPDSLLRRLAGSQAARMVVTGRVYQSDSVRIHLSVFDLFRGGRDEVTFVVARPGEPIAIATRAARVILARLLPTGGRLEEAAIARAAIPAVTAYLEGERAYRRGRYREADSLFGVAVARDSGFAWAALRGAQAANFLTARHRAQLFLDVALRHTESLGPRYAAFARGLDAYQKGEADRAVAEFRSALMIDPRWAEAHMALGEVYHHYLPRGVYLVDSAIAEFDSAMAIDRGFTAPLFHAIQHAIWQGDRTRADDLIARLGAVAPDSAEELAQVRLMRSCLDPLNATTWSRALAGRSLSAPVQAATWLAAGGLRYPECAIRALAAVEHADTVEGGWRPYLRLELAVAETARGNVASASRWLGELGTEAFGDIATLFLASSGLPIGALADSAAGRLRATPGTGVALVRGQWAVGTWLLVRGDLAGAKAMLDSVDGSTDSASGRERTLYGASLRARLTLARGDTAAAIRLLNLVPNAPQQLLRWLPWEAMPWERLTLARLLAARGKSDLAFQLAESFDSPASFGFAPWLVPSLKLRVELALRSREVEYAKTLNQRLEGLRAGASAP